MNAPHQGFSSKFDSCNILCITLGSPAAGCKLHWLLLINALVCGMQCVFLLQSVSDDKRICTCIFHHQLGGGGDSGGIEEWRGGVGTQLHLHVHFVSICTCKTDM